MDCPLQLLDRAGFKTMAYADDLVAIGEVKFDNIISERLQLAQILITKWCIKTGFTINSSKTNLLLFGKRFWTNFAPPTINSIPVNMVEELQPRLQHLGNTINNKLTWNPHINNIINEVIRTLFACKCRMEKHRNLIPKLLYDSLLVIQKIQRITWRDT